MEDCRRDRPRAFFKYAATYWTQHYKPVRQQAEPVHTFDYLLRPDDRFLKSWIFLHPSFNIEEEKLEPSGMWIEKMSHADEDNRKEFSKATFSYYHRTKSDKGQGRDSGKVLDYFFPLDPGMEDYDEQFLGGDHYWKTDKAGLSGEEGDTNDEDENEAEDGERIPDRVQSYRRRHQEELVISYADMSSPFSPGGGNPLTLKF